MKKLTTLILSLILIFALAACNQPAAQPNDPTPTPTATTLRVAMECAYAPFNWSQEDDSNDAVAIADSNTYANGYDVMVASRIAAAGDYNLQVVRLDWDSLIPALQSGEVDMVVAGQSITAERQEQVDFSAPYYQASIVALTLSTSEYAKAEGLSDLAGGTATSQLGTVWYDICLPQIEDVNMLPAQETASTMIIALIAQTVDYVVCDLPTAMAASAVYPQLTILDFTAGEDNFEVSAEEINLGISVRKGNTELLEFVNSVLAEVSLQDREDMMARAISIQPLSED